MLSEFLKTIFSCGENTDGLSDHELLEKVFEKTADIELSMEDIEDLRRQEPRRPLYIGVKNPAEFNLRHKALRAYLNDEYEKAEELSKKGLEMNPGSAYLHYILGAAKTNRCEHEEGIKELTRAVELNPKFSQAHVELAKAYFQRGIETTMEEQNLKTPQEALKRIGFTGDILIAEQYLINARDLTPTKPGAYDIIGRFYLCAGRPKLARQNLKEAIRYNTKLEDMTRLLDTINARTE